MHNEGLIELNSTYLIELGIVIYFTIKTQINCINTWKAIFVVF